MKSYSEIQQRIRELSDELNGLSCDLAELMAVQPKQAIDLQHISAVGARFPLHGHYLTGQEHKLQSAYLTLLTALAMQSESDPEAGLQQIQRILATISYDEALERIVTDANMLKEEQLDALTKTVYAVPEAIEPWLLDAIMLCIAGGNSEKQREFLSGIAELIGAQEHHVKNMVALAIAINNQDAKALGKCWESTDIPRFHYYLAPRDSALYIQSGEKMMLVGNGHTPFSDNNLIFHICYGSRKAYLYRTIFEGCDFNYNGTHLHMEDCILRDVKSRDRSVFRTYCSTELINCSFYNIETRDVSSTICLSGKCMISGLHMSNIKNTLYCGTWIYVDSDEKITVNGDCTYHDCVGKINGTLPPGFREI